MTVPQVLSEQARSRPTAPALQLVGEPALTYRDLYREACALAAGLRDAGVRRGEAVVIFGPNSREVVITWLAINLLGAVEVCINTAYRGSPLVHALNSSRARHIVASAEHLQLLDQVGEQLSCLEQVFVFHGDAPEHAGRKLQVRALEALRQSAKGAEIDAEIRRGAAHVAPSDIASIIYTSGTTGPAKGVLMPHAQVCLLAAMTVRGLKLAESDVFYCFHPMFHMAGKFMAILGTFMAGGHAVLDRAFSPDQWLTRVRAYRATAGLAHGPMVEMIHAQPERPDDLDNPMRRMVVAPFPTRIAREFERRFGLRGIEVWGMTEVGVPVWAALEEPLRLGSCGRNDEELFEVAIADPVTDGILPANQVGELVVRPRLPWLLMQGYMGMPEETVATWRNLWFHSGDSAYRDADGNFFFVDRLKDRIRRRAENISSYEIESAALTHPSVAEAAAVGVPSEFQGDDDIKLCVVTKAEATLDEPDLLAHLARHLPHYMLPRYVERLPALPRTPTNKVRKAELRASGVERVWDRKAAGIEVRNLYAK
jgi:carnitine-CoA ligase